MGIFKNRRALRIFSIALFFLPFWVLKTSIVQSHAQPRSRAQTEPQSQFHVQSQAQPRPQKYPIMTWPGPDKTLLSLEAFQKIAEAGFSINMSFFGERDINLKALDLAQQAGIQLLVQDGRIAKMVEDTSLPLTSLDPIIAVYKDHPAFWGYFILDEPNASKFNRIAEIFACLKGKDPIPEASQGAYSPLSNNERPETG